jgi:hypothetical protein
MRKTRTLRIIAAILTLEAAAVVALPSRVPRPARALTAAVDAAAAAGLWLLARQRHRE